jgi:hypothetical protein
MSSIEHIRSTPGYPDGQLATTQRHDARGEPHRPSPPTTSRGAPVSPSPSSTQATTTSSVTSTCIPRPPRSGTSRCNPGCGPTDRASTTGTQFEVQVGLRRPAQIADMLYRRVLGRPGHRLVDDLPRAQSRRSSPGSTHRCGPVAGPLVRAHAWAADMLALICDPTVDRRSR